MGESEEFAKSKLQNATLLWFFLHEMLRKKHIYTPQKGD